MDISGYMPRLIDKQIQAFLNVFGAVSIEGPKWCGKTWSSLNRANSSIFMGDPEGDFQNKRLAELSPALALEGETPRLIDEWQEVPALWDAVRHLVDQRGKKGQFILTGSSTPRQKGILHSGAGRIARLSMRPMSLFESGDSSGVVSLSALVQGEFEAMATGDVMLSRLTELVIRGGWPASIQMSLRDAALVPREYLMAVVEDDIYRLDERKRDPEKLRLLLRALARHESSVVSQNVLLRDMSEVDGRTIDTDTMSIYLDIFNRLFITDNLAPFSTHMRSRVRIQQSVKRQFVDPSLPASLLSATTDRLLSDLNIFGLLFESLVARDLKIYAEHMGAGIYHYRDDQNREVDAVMEMPDGHLLAFEIKLGTDRLDQAADSLIKWKDSWTPNGRQTPKIDLGIISGLSKAAYRRPDGVYVLPITALKP